MLTKEDRARQIQESIRQILLQDWDPIGVQEIPEAQDEYDSYVGGVYRLVAAGSSAQEIADHLWHIENETIGLPALDRAKLVPVAEKLRGLGVNL